MEEFNNNQNNESQQIPEVDNEIAEETLQEESPKKKSAAKELLEWIQAIAIAVVLALLVRNFVFTVVKVDGQSMEPTLQHADRMIVWRLGYEPEAGDIIIFNPPQQSKNVFWVKRVIATEGQTVEIDYNTNSIYVDGEKIQEEYLGEEMRDPMTNYDITEITVPKDCVFAMGDNRNHSTDSRFVGCISEDNIVGKSVVRFWPFTNMEIFKNPNDK